MSQIYIAHTPSQAEEASTLVDLLESSLSLNEGHIRCSTLPGYAGTLTDGDALRAEIAGTSAVIALLDELALSDAQLLFELGIAFSYERRLLLLVDEKQRSETLPVPLRSAGLVERIDRAALTSMIEDLAFDLGLRPRLGEDAQEAIRQLSSAPPPMPGATSQEAQSETTETDSTTVRPPLREAEPAAGSEAVHASEYEAIDTVPPAAPVPDLDPADADLELADPDLLELEPVPELAPDLAEATPQVSPPVPAAVGCELAFDAGRAMGECSFHRQEGEDVGDELDATYGRFIDAIGGNWAELRRFGDVEMWIGASDNLLEALPAHLQHLSDWFELGFQVSTLLAVIEQGLPAEPEYREAFEEIWMQSMGQFLRSAHALRFDPSDTGRLQAMLENLIGPDGQRDYSFVGRTLEELRAYAQSTDQHYLHA